MIKQDKNPKKFPLKGFKGSFRIVTEYEDYYKRNNISDVTYSTRVSCRANYLHKVHPIFGKRPERDFLRDESAEWYKTEQEARRGHDRWTRASIHTLKEVIINGLG